MMPDGFWKCLNCLIQNVRLALKYYSLSPNLNQIYSKVYLAQNLSAHLYLSLSKIKSYEQLEEDKISNLIASNSHPPTISYLSKCSRNKLPLVCDKCVQRDQIDIFADNSDTSEYYSEAKKSKSESSSYTHLGPVGVCEYDSKFCVYYQTKRQSNAANGVRMNSAPLSRAKHFENYETVRASSSRSHQKKKSKSELSLSSTSVSRTRDPSKGSNNREDKNKPKVIPKTDRDGDSYIKYAYTKNGLEIQRLTSKNFLIVDIFTSEVCKDQKDKSYQQWLSRKREIDEKQKKVYPSSIYEKQLEDMQVHFKKGRMTYEAWAKQSYRLLLLKEKIRKAKELEEVEMKQKNDLKKAELIDNVYNHWKMKKDAYLSRLK
jgi:hypothetical protein